MCCAVMTSWKRRIKKIHQRNKRQVRRRNSAQFICYRRQIWSDIVIQIKSYRMGHMWEEKNIHLLLDKLISWWFVVQAYIIQLETVEMKEEGKTKLVVGINRIKGKILCSYNRALMESIQMVFHLSISSFPGKMVQFALYNATTVMNGDTLQMIYLKLLLIVYVEDAAYVAEVNALA